MRNEHLVAARKKVGKTQKQIAQEAELAESAYQRYEHEKCIPNAVLAIKIAKALQSSVENLWGTGNRNDYKTTD